MEQFMYFQELERVERWHRPVATKHPHSRALDVLTKVGRAAKRVVVEIDKSL